MLTRLYIDNFRCFVNFDYRPERKQLLLGANGSGKSSLIDAIRLLKQFIAGDENPFTQSTRTRWQEKTLQVFEIEALLDRKKYEYRVEIEFEPDTKRSSVNLERLQVSGTTVFELANGQIRFFLDDGKQSTATRDTSKSALRLSQLSNSHVKNFVELMDNVHCFRIDACPSAMDEKADREERLPDYELQNLAGWYRHSVRNHPDKNVEFLNSMASVLDGFQDLRFSSEEDGVEKLRCHFLGPSNARVSYSLPELSEGQRCLLALYMILHFLITQGRTVFVDEPDNFIALREVQPWLLAAEAAVEDHQGQLVLISHHPEILNQWASQHGLHFFREKNGYVRAEKFKSDPNGNLQPSELFARGWEDE